MQKESNFTPKRLGVDATCAVERESLFYDEHSRSKTGDKERTPLCVVDELEVGSTLANSPNYKTDFIALRSVSHRTSMGKLMNTQKTTASRAAADTTTKPRTETVSDGIFVGRPIKVKLTAREVGAEIAPAESLASSAEGDELRNVSHDSSELRNGPSIDVMSEIGRMICMVCDNPGYYSKMVVCDACSNSCHTFCMRPRRLSVPLGHWLCPECHVVAQRHRIHLSRMVALKSEGECLVCGDNEEQKGSPEKQCVDCKLNFHRKCLLTKRKLKVEQVDDPQWKCQVCTQYETENVSPKEREERKNAAGQCHACSGFALLRGVLDMACAVCQLRFHRSCLQRLRKYTTEQLNDPQWTCVVCSMRDGLEKDGNKLRRPFSGPEPPQNKSVGRASSSVNGNESGEFSQRQHTSQDHAKTLLPTLASLGRVFGSGSSHLFQPSQSNSIANATLSFYNRTLKPDFGFSSSKPICEEDVVLDGSDMAEEGSSNNQRDTCRKRSFDAVKSTRRSGRSKSRFGIEDTGRRIRVSSNARGKGDNVLGTKSDSTRIGMHEEPPKLQLARSCSARKNGSDLYLFMERCREESRRRDIETLGRERHGAKEKRVKEKLKCDGHDDSQTEPTKKRRRKSILRKSTAKTGNKAFLSERINEEEQAGHGKLREGSRTSEIDGERRHSVGVEYDDKTSRRDELLDEGLLEDLELGNDLKADEEDAIVAQPDVACQDGAIKLERNGHPRDSLRGLERRKMKQSVAAVGEASIRRRSVDVGKGGGLQLKDGMRKSSERKGSAKGIVDDTRQQKMAAWNEVEHKELDGMEEEVLYIGTLRRGMAENTSDKEGEVMCMETERKGNSARAMNTDIAAEERGFGMWNEFTRVSMRHQGNILHEQAIGVGERRRESGHCRNTEWLFGRSADRIRVPRKSDDGHRPYSTRIGTSHVRTDLRQIQDKGGCNGELDAQREMVLDWWGKEPWTTAMRLQRSDIGTVTEDRDERATSARTRDIV